MKKIISFFLLLSILSSLMACKNGNMAYNNSQEPTDTHTSQPEQETGQNTETEKENSVNLSEVLASDIAKPGDVPKVLIYTNGKVIFDLAYTECPIIIVDEAGGKYETICDDKSTVKVRGNSTSAASKKPYNIKFSSKTDVLGMGKNKKWVLLANCFDKTLLRNQTVFDLAKQMGVPYTPDYRVVDVYVNNRLKGTYLLVDSIEVSKTRVNIDTSKNEFLLEVDYNPQDAESRYFYTPTYEIKFAINEPEMKDLTSEQYSYLRELTKNAEVALSSGNMEEIEKYFDIESMANFYLIQELFQNIDVNTSSTRFHVKDGKIFGGPVWDFDLSAGNYNRNFYKYVYDDNGNCYANLHAVRMPWFGALMEVDEFQDIVKQKFLNMQDIIVNLYEDNTLGQNYIDKTIETYQESISRNYGEAGWTPFMVYSRNYFERKPDSTYEENVEYYRNWLKNRNEWLLKEWGLKTP